MIRIPSKKGTPSEDLGLTLNVPFQHHRAKRQTRQEIARQSFIQQVSPFLSPWIDQNPSDQEPARQTKLRRALEGLGARLRPAGARRAEALCPSPPATRRFTNREFDMSGSRDRPVARSIPLETKSSHRRSSRVERLE